MSALEAGALEAGGLEAGAGLYYYYYIILFIKSIYFKDTIKQLRFNF